MAERRMFCKQIIDSDAFMDMSQSAQNLYFHLAMRADDDGFINNPKRIQKIVGANDDDVKILLAKRFILSFDSGVIVIKHWRMHNYLRADRYKPTAYQEEFAMLEIKDNESYTFVIPDNTSNTTGNQLATSWQPVVDVGKDRLGEVREGKVSIEEVQEPPNGEAIASPPHKLNKKAQWYKESDNWLAIKDVEEHVTTTIRETWNDLYYFDEKEKEAAKKMINRIRCNAVDVEKYGPKVFDFGRFKCLWGIYMDPKFWLDKDGAKCLLSFSCNFNRITDKVKP